MKYLYILALIITPITSIADVTITQFGEKLLNAGPKVHGMSLRDIKYYDIDGDGSNEILLHINKIEENSVGFLNIELYDAFVWIDVYSLMNGKYTKSTYKYKSFVKNRIAFYEKWLLKLNNPSDLENDSKNLIKYNKTTFKKTLEEHIYNLNHEKS